LYEIKPLDLVLFLGTDPVGSVITKIERKYVLPDLKEPFTAIWTHAGIVVDKSVLGYEWMEDGVLYLYESVFSGTVAGYKYSEFLPLDTKAEGFHLGPQVRKLLDVINEGSCDSAICPLTPEVRASLTNPTATQIIRDFHQTYLGAGYPLSILPQLGAASEGLFDALDAVKKWFPSQADEVDKKLVFCSELTALLYAKLGVEGFSEEKAGRLTPLELEVMDCFGGVCHFVKRSGDLLVKEDGKSVPVYRHKDHVPSLDTTLHWIPLSDDPTAHPDPTTVEAAGTDINLSPLFIARATIGRSLHPGKASSDLQKAHIPWQGIELDMHVRHEVLASVEGTTWKEGKKGEIPEGAVVVGYEETGELLYVARGTIKVDKWFKEDLRSECLGKTGLHTGGALMPFGGEEVVLEEGYEVLCLA
ncbi:hypothetical protein HK097_005819, partial [Rhizophlyctis rosea]